MLIFEPQRTALAGPRRWSVLLLLFVLFAPARGRAQTPPGEISVAPAREAVLHTSLGTIRLRFFELEAPRAVENFCRLSVEGYYDGVGFHRVVPGMLVQAGDPTGTGYGGHSAFGQPFADELDAGLRFTGPGRVAMANDGPNRNRSQFFITLKPLPWFDDQHTIFAEVVDGLHVVSEISEADADRRARPLEPILIESVELLGVE